MTKFKMEWVRLLGFCPSCGATDSISNEGLRSTDGGVRCSECETCWGLRDWLDRFAYQKEPSLVPVEVSITRRTARVELFQVQPIPYFRIIVSVLNAALVTRFKIGVCFATEGGVQGTYKYGRNREPIELQNISDSASFGLFDEHHFEHNPGCAKILKWYGELLYALFLDELEVNGKKLKRGEILRLRDDYSGDADNAKLLLYLAMRKKTGSEMFAKAVFTTLNEKLSSLGGMYLAGLSDEDIVKLYVPPSL